MSPLIAMFRRGFGENALVAFTAIRAHRLRAALAVLGIVAGVMTVTAGVGSGGAKLACGAQADPARGGSRG